MPEKRSGTQNRRDLPQGQEVSELLLSVYHYLENAYGDLGWWPADTLEEMVIGAILVQNVSWKNTVKALSNLNRAGLLNFRALDAAGVQEVAELVIPTRFYNMKANRLKSFARHVTTQYEGVLQHMLQQPFEVLRKELLAIPGIGPETADDILLYGAKYPSFVVDAYTIRVLSRCGIIPEHVTYEELRAWFMAHLPHNVPMFNQFHALLDRLGNRVCLAKRPHCDECPLQEVCDLRLQERTLSQS
ncbi:endonuclease III domain-containing protein [Alicyclobacillus mengziensis]|uniref:Endonuclease n=1 Tax=Alicyclobacillus mengziensis TaxID=2931921 RepID=A0A9X7VWB1_9BACL|nr:endonuclease [Alicyclobacillus mengziensis]QSO45809.1 endonuclease [Alicyclobacillus mengziensis]